MLANQAISKRAYSYRGKEPCDEAAREGKREGKCLLLLEEETLEGKEGSPGERRIVLRL